GAGAAVGGSDRLTARKSSRGNFGLLQHNLPSADATVGAATQHDAWCGTGVGRIFDDDDAVDDDGGARAARIAVWVRVSRLVAEVARVKNRDVGAPTLLQ